MISTVLRTRKLKIERESVLACVFKSVSKPVCSSVSKPVSQVLPSKSEESEGGREEMEMRDGMREGMKERARARERESEKARAREGDLTNGVLSLWRG